MLMRRQFAATGSKQKLTAVLLAKADRYTCFKSRRECCLESTWAALFRSRLLSAYVAFLYFISCI